MTGLLDGKPPRLSLDEVAEKWAEETGVRKAELLLVLYEAALAGEFEFPVHERGAAPRHPSTVEDENGVPHTVLLPAVGPYASALSLANKRTVNAAQLLHGLHAASGTAGSHTAVARDSVARDVFVAKEALHRWFAARGEAAPAFLDTRPAVGASTGGRLPASESRATKIHDQFDVIADSKKLTFERGELTRIATQIANAVGYKPNSVRKLITVKYRELKVRSQTTKIGEPAISDKS